MDRMRACGVCDVGSIPTEGTIRELIGFLEAKMRDARSASQGFPPNSPNEFRIFGALARTVFSPRSRFEPKISLATDLFSKKVGIRMQFCPMLVRLLPSFGKVRANHFACVKEKSFLLRATSFAKVVFLFQNDKFLFQYLGQDIQ